jgi:hypothetical protein
LLQNDAANECCKEVDVKELAAAYRNETGREPMLLVDGRNCLRSTCLCCFKTEELLLGGQMQKFINNMKDFLAAYLNEWSVCCCLKVLKIEGHNDLTVGNLRHKHPAPSCR